MSEMSARPAIDQVWVVEATYAPDAPDTRVPFRAEHLGRIVRLMDEGVIVMAGAYLDVSTSLVFLNAATEEEALAIARQDPYTREGVWVELRARPFGRVITVEPEAHARA
jgi:hypothetical protein